MLTRMTIAMTMLVVGSVPALAQESEAELDQVPVSMVDCVIGGPCIGTSGNDTINGSDKQDVIYGLEGDDIIDSGNDSVTDYVFCGPGFDTVNQMPRVVDDRQGAIQYGATGPDVIADDCEISAL
jgi:Ca2+-binding RTX toxin-like protein